MKSREEIRAETPSTPTQQRRFAPPQGYVPHSKLTEWDASLPAGAEDLLERCQPRNDRMLVRLLSTKPKGGIVLTDREPLIGGCRKAVVLKTGPGRWIEGEWWNGLHRVEETGFWDIGWYWTSGYRRSVSVTPGQIVLIGNWVDLEAGGLALCQEGDIRAVLPEMAHDSWAN